MSEERENLQGPVRHDPNSDKEEVLKCYICGDVICKGERLGHMLVKGSSAPVHEKCFFKLKRDQENQTVSGNEKYRG